MSDSISCHMLTRDITYNLVPKDMRVAMYLRCPENRLRYLQYISAVHHMNLHYIMETDVVNVPFLLESLFELKHELKNCIRVSIFTSNRLISGMIFVKCSDGYVCINAFPLKHSISAKSLSFVEYSAMVKKVKEFVAKPSNALFKEISGVDIDVGNYKYDYDICESGIVLSSFKEARLKMYLRALKKVSSEPYNDMCICIGDDKETCIKELKYEIA